MESVTQNALHLLPVACTFPAFNLEPLLEEADGSLAYYCRGILVEEVFEFNLKTIEM